MFRISAAASLFQSGAARRLVGGTIWSATGEALARGSMLLSLILAARILGSAGYGELGLLRTTVATFTTLGGMGLGLTANRFIAQYRTEDRPFAGQIIGSSYTLAIILGVCVGAAVMLFAREIAVAFLGNADLTEGIRLAAVLIPLSSVTGAQIGVLQGLEAYRRLAFASGFQAAVGLIALPVGALAYGVEGALAGLFVHAAVGLFAFELNIRAELRRLVIRLDFSSLRRVLPIIRRFSVPAALMGMAVAPFKWVSEATLAAQSGFGELGIFHGAMLITNIFIALVTTLNAPLIAVSATGGTGGAVERLQRISLYASWYLYLAATAPLILFPGLAELALGSGYRGDTLTIVVLLVILYGALLSYYQGIVRLVAQHGSMWLTLMTNIVEGITLLVAFYLLSSLGAAGLAFAYILSYVVRIAVSLPLLHVQKLAPLRVFVAPAFVASLALVVAVILVQLSRVAGTGF